MKSGSERAPKWVVLKSILWVTIVRAKRFVEALMKLLWKETSPKRQPSKGGGSEAPASATEESAKTILRIAAFSKALRARTPMSDFSKRSCSTRALLKAPVAIRPM
ncbi:hypothetical protein QR680_012802 [Steinernema hermaphroditum]|uniref:Uncharacterized protein n=1 Tax=Steinernema hermaphroditum TaxID=289476 RepID=A0AA39I5C4_9BILA|nr:hypothetical protein QR680_012802 [Steinernema hermaphroditum]